MAFSYKVTQNAGDSHQSTPFWLMAVVRYKYRDTYNRANGSASDGSYGPFTEKELAIQEASEPGSLYFLRNNIKASIDEMQEFLLIREDCISWSTTAGKANHISNLQAQLVFREVDYCRAIAPEDWVMLWAFDNYDDYERVFNKIKEKKRANHFNDGLKFIGRVQSVFRTYARSPNNGIVQAGFELNAAGFSEFDSTIFYNEAVARTYNNVMHWMADFGTSVNEFIVAGSIDANDAIPKLMRICLGLGPGNATKDIVGTDLQISPNNAFLIPQTVGKLLLGSFERTTKPVGLTYADLFKQWIGVQSYTGRAAISSETETDGWDIKTKGWEIQNTDEAFSDDTSRWRGFVPDYESNALNTYVSPVKLTGDFLPQPLHFNRVTVWSLLGTYLNDPINEMYTCLRVDETGHIRPTLTVRQVPFSSNTFIKNGEVGTPFVSLPRWDIDNSLVQQLRVGRSNAARFNYVHVTGMSPVNGNTAGNQVINFINAPPIVDSADIVRSGLRMYQAQVGAKVIQTDSRVGDNPGRKWTKLMADMLMGGHLKYSGIVALKGVQAPICPGDNCVVDNVIYHIEQVTHSGSIAANGNKEFNTTLQVSNGIAIASDFTTETVYPDSSTSALDIPPEELGNYDFSEDIEVTATDNNLFGFNKV